MTTQFYPAANVVPEVIPVSSGPLRLRYPFTNQFVVTIDHNQGQLVSVIIWDAAGNQIEGQIITTTLNTLTISFSEPLSGTVVIN